MAHLVKNLPTMRETWVLSLGWEDPLEKGKATHSSILAWYSPWGHKESETTERLSLSLQETFILSRIKTPYLGRVECFQLLAGACFVRFVAISP